MMTTRVLSLALATVLLVTPAAFARPYDDVQAPRSDEVQAPRSDEVQAPRSDEVQAPRSDDVQAPRG